MIMIKVADRRLVRSLGSTVDIASKCSGPIIPPTSTSSMEKAVKADAVTMVLGRVARTIGRTRATSTSAVSDEILCRSGRVSVN